MGRKSLILVAILLVIAAGVIYTYREFNRTGANIADEAASYTVSASDLIKEFTDNDSVASRKYVGKIISIEGFVKDLNRDERGYYAISLGDTAGMSTVRCSIDSIYSTTVSSVKAGMKASVKGTCTGYNEDELLGLDVIVNRCLIVKYN